MDNERDDRVTELIGVYHADGGLVGEARYVIGHLLGRTECALCDITHSPVRRRPAWDRMVATLGVPFRLFHLNEMPTDVATVVGAHGSPLVAARLAGTGIRAVLDGPALARLDGSVPAFEASLRAAVAERGWRLPDAPFRSTAPAS